MYEGKKGALQKGEIKKASFYYHQGAYQCFRCQSWFQEAYFLLKDNQTNYCPYCQQMGLLKTTESMNYEKTPEFLLKEASLTLKYPLSSFQRKASEWLMRQYEEGKKEALLWAVTGAGKTEMTYPFIQTVLKKGGIVVWASPRVDVCLEIYPRLKASFQDEKIALLHGKSEEVYENQQLVVATCHQLLRFKEAFDVIIIDEVDAFPYVNDSLLQNASKNALKPAGFFASLTATPTKDQLKKMQKNQLAFYLLPARFHGHPLVVPKFMYQKNYRTTLLKALKKDLHEKLATKRWLIFCPEIKWMQFFEENLKRNFPNRRVVSIYASDSKRQEKVQALRREEYDLICTTTILERGVTLKDIHVLVIGSHERIYKKEVLVQIAGRVGRHHDFPAGEVLFLHQGISRGMKQARKEIIQLNKKGQEEGYLS